MKTAAIATLFLALGLGRCRAEGPPKAEMGPIPADHPRLFLAPYVWKVTGKGAESRAEAAMPGAYLRAEFRGSGAVGLRIDGEANRDCPPQSMPVVEVSVDSGPFRSLPTGGRMGVETVGLAAGLDVAKSHRVEVVFRASDLTKQRWASSLTHLRIAGLALDEGATLLDVPTRPRRAIAFGDSITEGVGVDGLFKSWESLDVNNARATWFPIACAALDCEYGQLGTGGHGMSRPIQIPPLNETWDRFDPETSRLTGGKLLPEPDYAFCALGTNDFETDITADYTRWLASMRAACPNARIFCVVPQLGWHEREIRDAVEARRKGGDDRVHLVDTPTLRHGFRAGQGATQFALDGVHPTVYGQGVLGAAIAVEAQKALGPSK